MWSQRSPSGDSVRASTDEIPVTTSSLGEVHLAALSDFETADVFKPEFLDKSSRGRVNHDRQAKKVQDLKITGGGRDR